MRSACSALNRRKLEEALEQIRSTREGEERNMYPAIKDAFCAAGWPQESVKVDTSIGKQRGIPDFAVLNRDSGMPWIVGEAKSARGLFASERNVQEILQEKRKYMEADTEWFVLVDPDTWVIVPVMAFKPDIQARKTFRLHDAQERNRLAAFLEKHLSPSAMQDRAALRKFLEGDTSHIGCVEPKKHRDEFFATIERCSSILFDRIRHLADTEAADYFRQMADLLSYFHSIRPKSGDRNILRFSQGDVALNFTVYAAQNVDWEELESKQLQLSLLYRKNPPLFRFYYHHLWMEGRDASEHVLHEISFGSTILFLAKALTVRMLEDHSFFGNRILSNGGMEAFVRMKHYIQQGTTNLVRWGTQLAERFFPSITEETIYDWVLYIGDQALSRATELVLYWLSLFDFKQVSGDLLSEIYAKLVSPIARKKHGQVFTPYWLADFIAERALELAETDSEPISVLDPACGSGSFLVAFLERTAGDRLRRRMIDYDTFKKVVEKLHGNDIDPFAVAIARMQLFWHFIPFKDMIIHNKVPLVKISTGDALEIDNKLFAPGGTWKIYDRRTYDAVVGNPPYVRPEILKQEKTSAEDSAFYGKLARANLRTRFVFKALKRWVKEGGILAFVLPLSVLDSKNDAHLRKLLRTQWTIREIVDLEFAAKEVFPDVAVNPIVLIVQKKQPSDQDEVVLRFLDGPPAGKGKDMLAELKEERLAYGEIFTRDGRILSKLTRRRLDLIKRLQDFPTFEDIARSWWRKKEKNRFVAASLNPPKDDGTWEESKMIGMGVALRRERHAGTWNLYKGENILPCQLVDKPVEKGVDVAQASDPSFWRFPGALPQKGYAFLQICRAPTACPFDPSRHAFLNTATLFFPKEELEDFPFDFLVLASIYRFYHACYLRDGALVSGGSHLYPSTLRKLPWSEKLAEHAGELRKLREQYLDACRRTNQDIVAVIRSKVKCTTLEELGRRKSKLALRFSQYGDSKKQGWKTIHISLFEWVQVNDKKIAALLESALEVYNIREIDAKAVLKLEIPDPDDADALRKWNEIIGGSDYRNALNDKQNALQRLDEIVFSAFGFDKKAANAVKGELAQGFARILTPDEPYTHKNLKGLLTGLDSGKRYEY